MAGRVEQIYRDALGLPDESKAHLAERLVEYLETHIDPGLESKHLDIIRKRREQVLSGSLTLIDGPKALRSAPEARAVKYAFHPEALEECAGAASIPRHQPRPRRGVCPRSRSGH